VREAALEAAHEAATAHKGGAALASAAINSSAIGKSPVVDVSNYYSPGQGTLSDESDDADVGYRDNADLFEGPKYTEDSDEDWHSADGMVSEDNDEGSNDGGRGLKGVRIEPVVGNVSEATEENEDVNHQKHLSKSTKKRSRKCGECGYSGHNKRTCNAKSMPGKKEPPFESTTPTTTVRSSAGPERYIPDSVFF